MPNGRTGGFFITKADLGELLKQFPDDAEVGNDVSPGGRIGVPAVPVTASELVGLVNRHKKEQVSIEEQDSTYYIVHLRTWITVDQSSSLYSHLRRYHVEWVQNQVSSRETE